MQTAKVFGIWAEQFRAPFLLLPVMLVSIGGAAAHHHGIFNGVLFALCMTGVGFAHSAVNLFNEYADDASGIDRNTRRTPFSGGSGNLQSGRTTPASVLIAACVMLSVACAIGLCLAVVCGWPVLLFMLIGGLAVIFYTSHLSRWGLGEFAAGLCLGSFVVVGTYYTMARSISPEIALLSLPPGILTSLLLLLNEFPDAQADRQGGRRHLVILLGWKMAAVIYATALLLSYAIIAAGVFKHWFPHTVLLVCLTLPLGIIVSCSALSFGDQHEKMTPILGVNVGAILATDLLMAIGYLL